MKKRFTCFGAALLACCMLFSACGGNGNAKTTSATHTTSATATSTSQTTQTNSTTSATTSASTTGSIVAPEKTLLISEAELRDKMEGGWIGQMVGVAWAASTEFAYQGQIMPANKMPTWYPSMINNAFNQDDLYVEVPFMDAMKENGALCKPEYMADKFRTSTFPLWHANKEARDNLLAGIGYPYSGHFLYNPCADDIDWQIECDFLGQMYPGLVNEAALRAFELGHITNYGDGVYGGVFVTAMHAAAYTATSVTEIAEAGVASIPDGTKFKSLMNDIMASYKQGDTWEICWQKIETKWGADHRCSSGSKFNIDAKLNAGYILIGLLWGEGDFEKTIIISTRCGQDSDCNPSSAASVLGTFYGASGIPDLYKRSLDRTGTNFSCTEYSFDEIIDLNIDLMNQVLKANGATLEGGVWTLETTTAYTPVPYEQWNDDFIVRMDIKYIGDGEIQLDFSESGKEKVVSYKIDLGDGYVSDEKILSYKYKEYGSYTVRCTVTSDKGTKLEIYQQIKVVNVPKGTPICSVTAPTGGGNKDMNVMFDGYVPYLNGGSDVQYDTYDGGAKKENVWAGVQFDGKYTISGVEFTEGKHFHDGGWFSSAPDIEVLVGGVWQKAETSISAPYPTGNTQSAHGNHFDIYIFTFDTPIECEGVRISGKPGGSAYFISIGEITPLVWEK